MYIRGSTYVFADEGGHDEGGEAVGTDDEAVNGGRAAFFFRDSVVQRKLNVGVGKDRQAQTLLAVQNLGKNGGKRQTAKEDVSVVTNSTAKMTD
jgi:hypothetical protein